MTYSVRDDQGNLAIVVIEHEPPSICARCKEQKECRPIAADLNLCFGCATEEEKDAYVRRLFGDEC